MDPGPRGCWGPVLASQGPPTPDLSKLGYSETPRGQEHESKVHDRVRIGTLGNPGESIKSSEALTSSPTPFRKHKSSREEETERGQKKRGRLGTGAAVLRPNNIMALLSQPPQPSPFHCLHLGGRTPSHQVPSL